MANRATRLSIPAALIVIGAFLLPMPGFAANNCPWMNEATAWGLLGADGVGAFTQGSPGQPAVCTFNSETQGVRRALRITVEVTPEARSLVALAAQECTAGAAPLRAIGNEAFVCIADVRKGMASVRALGRVRDQYFTIIIASTQRNDPVLTPDALKSKIYTAAEQVSGNLF
jgi:hypothetical protein